MNHDFSLNLADANLFEAMHEVTRWSSTGAIYEHDGSCARWSERLRSEGMIEARTRAGFGITLRDALAPGEAPKTLHPARVEGVQRSFCT